MNDETVHIKQNPGRLFDSKSYCGIDLNQCSFFPSLYVEMYRPKFVRHCIYSVVNEDIYFPVVEMVRVAEDVNFCEDCLSWNGMALLNSVFEGHGNRYMDH